MKKSFAIIALMVSILFSSQATYASEWTLDKAHTQVKFKVKHLTVANVWGEFHTFDGKVVYDPSNPDAASVNVSVDINSIDTGNESRDGHLKSEDFFYTEKYPNMTFVSKKIVKSGNGLKLVGDLTIRGVTKEVTLDVEGPTGPVMMMGTEKIAATATGKINRTDFGMNWNKAIETGGLIVSKKVNILLEVELNKAG